MPAYFVDTNFFLEFKKASELSWDEITHEDPVRLFVPKTVVAEINEHKGRGSSRKSKRARDVSSDFRKIIGAPDGRIVLREKSPRVTLEFPPILKPDYSKWPMLDRLVADDQIVADVATFNDTVEPAAILTDDTNVVVLARAIAVPSHLLPETWQLDPEADAQTKEIYKLNDELRRIKNTKPDIKLSVLHLDTEDNISQVTLLLKTYSNRSRAIENVLKHVQRLNPLETNFELTPPPRKEHPLIPAFSMHSNPWNSTWRAPTEDEIRIYQEKSYPRWIEDVRTHLQSIASRLVEDSSRGTFLFSIQNTGFANATNARLTITAYGRVLLVRKSRDDDDEKSHDGVPPPPTPPKGRYEASSLSGLDSIMGRYSSIARAELLPTAFSNYPSLRSLHTQHDPNGFYYLNPNDDHANIFELKCDAVPHQVAARQFEYDLLVLPSKKDEMKPRLRLLFQASNLSTPVQKDVTVVIEDVSADLEAELLAKLYPGQDP